MLPPELSFDVLGPVLEDVLTRLEHDVRVSTHLSARFLLVRPDSTGRWRCAYFREVASEDPDLMRRRREVVLTDDGRAWVAAGGWWTRYSDLDEVPWHVVGQITRWVHNSGVRRWPRCRGRRRHRMRFEHIADSCYWVCPENGSRVGLGELERREPHRRPITPTE